MNNSTANTLTPGQIKFLQVSIDYILPGMCFISFLLVGWFIVLIIRANLQERKKQQQPEPDFTIATRTED